MCQVKNELLPYASSYRNIVCYKPLKTLKTAHGSMLNTLGLKFGLKILYLAREKEAHKINDSIFSLCWNLAQKLLHVKIN